MTVRTRFAPSPTGYMHVGGLRTALFAWLVARQSNGKFVLRIEDTDQNREVQGSIAHIIESLGWLGIDYDEGPNRNDNGVEYIQSKRLAIYKQWADFLCEKGLAYADPYSAAEVDAFRQDARTQKKPFLYRNYRPENPPKWDGSTPLRLKSDPKEHTWHDEVMGNLHSGPESIDDIILMKSDGYPTYNFAHIIDDHEMGISHVIRGQEFLPSVPKYLNIYEALGFDVPIFATLPHIMNEAGNKKLSKRDGAKDILRYREEGYLPAAMINFLATLGWNDGTDKEVFSVAELIKDFSLKRVHKSGAVFDERRLLWLQGAHVRELPLDTLFKIVSPFDGGFGFWPKEAFDDGYTDAYRKQVLGLVQERLKFFAELPELTRFFFTDLPADMSLIDDHKQLKKLDHSELHALLEQAIASLEQSDFSLDDVTARLNDLLVVTGQKPAVLFSLIRVATTWAPASPGLADTLHVLGKARTMARLAHSLDVI